MTRLASVLIAAAVAGCTTEGVTDPPALREITPDGLRSTLVVEPAEVPQHGSFTVRLTVSNPGTESVEVVTAHGCLAIPHVFRNGEPIPLRGSWWACTAAITRHVFAPGESRTITWNMSAELYAREQGDPDGAPAPKGSYQVVAEFDTYAEGSNTKPRVVHPLTIH